MTESLGVHSSAVEEVLEWALRVGVLQHPFDAERVPRRDFFLISHIDDIDRFRDPDYPAAQLDGDWCWGEIRTWDDEYFQTAVNDAPAFTDDIWPRIDDASRSLYAPIRETLLPLLPDVEINTICSDIRYIMLARGAMGITGFFWERLYQVYRAGGYPCGWKGEYPEGQLVVFCRPSSPTSNQSQ